MEKKFMLIDGNSLLYRAFYALPPLHTREGIHTNGVYGFLTMFNRVVAEVKPTHILVAFDKDRKTFRNETYQEYKANRSETPDELKGQFQILRDLLLALNVDHLEMQGYEADDIIGTFSQRAEAEGIQTVIVTGDGDTLQLVSELTRVHMTKKGISEIEIYDPAGVVNKWEVGPDKMVEIKGLMGDTSDNIPGVPGVGPKTAIKLVKEFGSLENLYENIAAVNGKKLKETLEQNREQAFLSRELATIVRDIDIEFNLDDYSIKEPKRDDLLQLYRSLEFNNFLNALLATKPERTPLEDVIKTTELHSREEVQRFASEIEAGECIAMHLETDYHHPMWAKIRRIYIEYRQEVFLLDVEEQGIALLDGLRPILENDSILKYLHNAKFMQVLLLRYDIHLQGVKGDTLLLNYVLDPSFAGDDLDSIIGHHFNIDTTSSSMAYQVSRIRDLYELLYQAAAPELKALLEDLELPLSEILGHAEFCGVKVDKKILGAISEELGARLEKDEARIFELAGSNFNINSPKQLGVVLFETLGLPGAKKTKTGYATGQEILENLCDQHEIIPYILDYRQLSKLKSTYTDALQELINPESGRVHTIFKQATTATGRLSSVEPNLQNIPIKMEEGRRIRKAFVASSKEWLIFSADYSQIDLRSLAHISGDETLIETFRQGIDIHTRTAAEIFDVPLEKVDSTLRRRAKAVNFGIIYGISDFGLARDTGVSRKEAGRYIQEYLDSYPGVRKYMEDVVEFGKETGYVETVLKRRRYLPDLRAKNKMVQSFARRMALNTPIQGTSADIIKLAMIKVAACLRAQGLSSRLLLQVHDELVLEVNKNELEKVAYLVKDCMENAYPLKVPLIASMKVGTNWYDMQNWE